MYTDDIKLCCKNEKELVTDTNNKNIHSGYRNEIWHRQMCDANNEKRKKTNNGRNRTAKKKKKSECLKESKIRSSWEYWKETP